MKPTVIAITAIALMGLAGCAGLDGFSRRTHAPVSGSYHLENPRANSLSQVLAVGDDTVLVFREVPDPMPLIVDGQENELACERFTYSCRISGHPSRITLVSGQGETRVTRVRQSDSPNTGLASGADSGSAQFASEMAALRDELRELSARLALLEDEEEPGSLCLEKHFALETRELDDNPAVLAERLGQTHPGARVALTLYVDNRAPRALQEQAKRRLDTVRGALINLGYPRQAITTRVQGAAGMRGKNLAVDVTCREGNDD